MAAVMLCSVGALYAQSPEVQVNTSSGVYYPNEPSVCISKTKDNTVVAGANTNSHYYSKDNGKTWENKTLKSTFGVWGDPVLHSDAEGNIYFVHLSHTAGKEKNYGFIDRIVVQTSSDNGETFNNGAYVGLNEPKMQDKPWVSTDDYSSNYKGNAYLTWTEFDKLGSKKKKHQSRIRFAASSNYGMEWSKAITISDSVGDCIDDDETLEGATTAVDALGNIYCVWAGHHRLYFDKSMDGGKTWGRDRVIFEQKSGWAMDIPHVYRSNGMPFLVVDNSAGEYTGRLYLVWGDDKFGDADVLLSYSDDQGSTWSVPKRVHRDPTASGKSQYLPNVAIDPTTGHLAIVYYNRQSSMNNVFDDVYLSLTKNGGESFEEFRLNEKIINHPGKEYFSGDYIDVDFYDGKISAIWSGYDGSPNVYCRTINENELYTLFPIHEVGQMLLFKGEGRKPTVYIAATVPCEITITYFKKPLFSKKLKEKSKQVLDINHRPGLQGYGETKVKMAQKRRIKIVARNVDRVKPSDKQVYLEIP